MSIVIPWLALNNSVDSSYDYNLNVSQLDIKHGRIGLTTALSYNQEIGNEKEADRINNLIDKYYPEFELYRQGKNLLNSKDYVNAERYFLEALKHNPQAGDIYHGLAECQFHTGRYHQALESLQYADAYNPGSWHILYLKALTYAALKDFDRGIKYLHQCIYYDKNTPDPYIVLGHYYYNTAQYDSALYYYTALPENSYPPEIFIKRAQVYQKLRDKLKMKTALSKYLEVGRDSMMLQQARLMLEQLK